MENNHTTINLGRIKEELDQLVDLILGDDNNDEQTRTVVANNVLNHLKTGGSCDNQDGSSQPTSKLAAVLKKWTP